MTEVVSMPEALSRALSILVHGASKSGKSTFGVTTPAPRLLLDVEGGARFLPVKPIVWDPAKERPPEYSPGWNTAVVVTRDWGTVEKVYQWLASGQHCFRSLTIDSVSELQQRHIEMIGHRQQLTQTQWGDTFRAVTGLIRDVRDLTIHPTNPIEAVVMTAMTRQIDGMWRPWMQGQTQTVIPYLLDVTAYLYVELVTNELSGEQVERRRLITRRMGQFEAGERVWGRIPPVVELRQIDGMMPDDDGAMAKMIKLIFGERPSTAIDPLEPPEPETETDGDSPTAVVEGGEEASEAASELTEEQAQTTNDDEETEQ